MELPDLMVRTKLLVNNPVVAARVYHRVIRAFFDIICGMPLSHFTGQKQMWTDCYPGIEIVILECLGGLRLCSR